MQVSTQPTVDNLIDEPTEDNLIKFLFSFNVVPLQHKARGNSGSTAPRSMAFSLFTLRLKVGRAYTLAW